MQPRKGPLANLKVHFQTQFAAYYALIEQAEQSCLDPIKAALPEIMKRDHAERAKAFEGQMRLDKWIRARADKANLAKGQLLMTAWMIEKAISARAIESDFFKAALSAFGLAAGVAPDRHVAHMTILNVLYEIAVEKRESEMAGVKTYAVTSDGATVDGHEHTTSLTISYIKDFKHSHVVGGVRYVHAQSAEQIAHFIETECEAIVGVDRVLVAIVQDGASACKKAGRKLVGSDSVHCAAHRANLVVHAPLVLKDGKVS